MFWLVYLGLGICLLLLVIVFVSVNCLLMLVLLVAVGCAPLVTSGCFRFDVYISVGG